MISLSPKKRPTINDLNKTKRVVVFGAFDIIHPGHLQLFRQAAALGNLIVVLGRDNTITVKKGKKPYYNETQRIKNITKLNIAKEVILGSIKDPYLILDIIKPDIIMLGTDQKIFVDKLHEEIAKRKLVIQILRADEFHLNIFKSSKIRSSLENKQAGFLFINKPTGFSSHDVVKKLRNICGTKRVGHAGTLDPLATGMLIVGINEATKLLSWWQLFPKKYQVEMEFGKKSDTYDIEGDIKNVSDKKITKKNLENIINKFRGNISQTPPAFSAKKINGVPAYKLARQGKKVKLKKQLITIYHIAIKKFNFPKAILEIECSSGTYIRSIVNDIRMELKVGAIMTKLVRTSTGPISQNKEVELDKIDKNNWETHLNPATILTDNINDYFYEQELKT